MERVSAFFAEGLLLWLLNGGCRQGSFKGELDIDIDVDVGLDVDIDLGCRYFGYLKGVSKAVQVLLNGIEAVMLQTVIVLKQRALL